MFRLLLLLVVLVHPQVHAVLPNVACQGPPSTNYAFCNSSLSIDERVMDLISHLKTEEKPGQLMARHSLEIKRIGLPPYYWGINAIHGLGGHVPCLKGKCPTSFPNPCGLGATFNMSVVHSMGQVISTEMRAFFNLGEPNDGLDTWSPNININRDPRWGRNQEVPSEDPFIAGQFGVAYTKGVQEGKDKRYVFGVTTLKHFDAYSYEGPDEQRLSFNAIVSKYDLASTYMPAFKASVEEGGALGIMCSYNALNGVPNCANDYLNHTLRGSWGFKGYISSDSGAVSFEKTRHHYVKTIEEAVADSINSGTDVDSHLPDTPVLNPYYEKLTQAVKDGKVQESTVDTALARTYRLRFQLGLFDPHSGSPYFKYGFNDIATPASQQAARDAALQSMVLLQNNQGILPFKPGIKLAVIGPNANSTDNMMGNYVGNICPHQHGMHKYWCVKTILDEITEVNNRQGGSTTYSEGCGVQEPQHNWINQAVEVAKKADYVVLVMGLDQNVEREGHDRAEIGLPGLQNKLISAIMNLNKPTAGVLINGGSVSIDEMKSEVPAIIEAWYPSTYGGYAVSRVLFGMHNPGGKLPVTVYPKDYVNKIKDTNMNMTTGVGRSYRYYKGTPLYPFGHGLSYTSFSLSWSGSQPSTWRVSSASDKQTFNMVVKNTGKMDGTETVMAFFVPQKVNSDAPVPKKQLIAFDKVGISKGGMAHVSFTVTASEMGLADSAGNINLMAGSYSLSFSRGIGKPLEVAVDVSGTATVIPSLEMIGPFDGTSH
eukprot:TRINITY_DN63623_c0_g1_i1.p1 TRINITY_DN63623_c0_g1~~TRINITY_DN63623_c0_g1_i1.p1  ORF type:complete len:768 (+),score=83.27 TRINITY_DN63623_c0_g1_i1:22-2325(+)